MKSHRIRVVVWLLALGVVVSLQCIEAKESSDSGNDVPFIKIGNVYRLHDGRRVKIAEAAGEGWFRVQDVPAAQGNDAAPESKGRWVNLRLAAIIKPDDPDEKAPPANEVPQPGSPALSFVKIGGRYHPEMAPGASFQTWPYWIEVRNHAGGSWYEVEELVPPWYKGPHPHGKMWLNLALVGALTEAYYKGEGEK
jgi:hypothetical protein